MKKILYILLFTPFFLNAQIADWVELVDSITIGTGNTGITQIFQNVDTLNITTKTDTFKIKPVIQSSGAVNLVQLSNGSGGFASDVDLNYTGDILFSKNIKVNDSIIGSATNGLRLDFDQGTSPTSPMIMRSGYSGTGINFGNNVIYGIAGGGPKFQIGTTNCIAYTPLTINNNTDYINLGSDGDIRYGSSAIRIEGNEALKRIKLVINADSVARFYADSIRLSKPLKIRFPGINNSYVNFQSDTFKLYNESVGGATYSQIEMPSSGRIIHRSFGANQYFFVNGSETFEIGAAESYMNSTQLVTNRLYVRTDNMFIDPNYSIDWIDGSSNVLSSIESDGSNLDFDVNLVSVLTLYEDSTLLKNVSIDTNHNQLGITNTGRIFKRIESFGNIFLDSVTTAITISVTNTWYPITGFTGDISNNMTLGTDTIFIDYDGIYKVSNGGWSALSSVSGSDYEIGVSINGDIPLTEGRCIRSVTSSNWGDFAAGSFYHRFTAGEYLLPKIIDLTSTRDIQLRYGGLTVEKIN